MNNYVMPQSRLRLVNLTGGIDVLVEANPRRRGITLFASRTVGLTIGDRDMLTALVGANIPFSQRPYHFCGYTHGDWVKREILVLATGVGTCAVLEVIE